MTTTTRTAARRLAGAGLALTLPAAVLVATATPAAAQTLPAECAQSGLEVTCTYDAPGTYTFTVPDDLTEVTAAAFGAQGGDQRGAGGAPGGSATAPLDVTPGATLQINVGGRGADGSGGVGGGAGGFNGGGRGGDSQVRPELDAPGGGGASDIRIGGTALADRVLVGGGGGGAGTGSADNGLPGGAGGGATGGAAGGFSGRGGTQTEGGAGGVSGTRSGEPGVAGTGGAGSAGGEGGGGGGGGGLFGGGGGVGVALGGGGGGGGSGFGPAGVVFETGVRSGDGLVTITYELPDEIPPTVTCTADPAVLTPPDAQLRDVSVEVTVNDDGSGPAGFILLSVTSDQPDPTALESIVGWEVGTADTDGQLRALRRGADRTYTLVYEGADQAGNTATCATTVTVTLPSP